jgi:hypothetical protein
MMNNIKKKKEREKSCIDCHKKDNMKIACVQADA